MLFGHHRDMVSELNDRLIDWLMNENTDAATDAILCIRYKKIHNATAALLRKSQAVQLLTNGWLVAGSLCIAAEKRPATKSVAFPFSSYTRKRPTPSAPLGPISYAANRRHFSFPASFDVLTGFSAAKEEPSLQVAVARQRASQRASIIQIPWYGDCNKGASPPSAVSAEQLHGREDNELRYTAAAAGDGVAGLHWTSPIATGRRDCAQQSRPRPVCQLH